MEWWISDEHGSRGGDAPDAARAAELAFGALADRARAGLTERIDYQCGDLHGTLHPGRTRNPAADAERALRLVRRIYLTWRGAGAERDADRILGFDPVPGT